MSCWWQGTHSDGRKNLRVLSGVITPSPYYTAWIGLRIITRCVAKPSLYPSGANPPAKRRGYWTIVHQTFTCTCRPTWCWRAVERRLAENAHISPVSVHPGFEWINRRCIHDRLLVVAYSFHSLMTRSEKKFCLVVVLHLGLNNFNECPLSPLVTSDSWKNLLESTCSFPVIILNVSIKSPRNLRLSKE